MLISFLNEKYSVARNIPVIGIDNNAPEIEILRRFTENRENLEQFNKYVFVDSGKIIGVLGKEPPLLQRREEFKIEEAREIWEKLISQGWKRTKLFE